MSDHKNYIKNGNAQFALGNYEEALFFYQMAIKSNPAFEDIMRSNFRSLEKKLGTSVYEKLIFNNSRKNISKKVKVSVICVTYNHAEFISNALKGFEEQVTNFNFEIIIGDDASTDETSKIIQSYVDKNPHKYKFISRNKNLGATQNWIDLLSQAQGQYVAINDGDDYWTDPLKLQLQVDYLDSHPECSVCFHPVKVLKQGFPDHIEMFPISDKQIFSTTDLMHQNFMQSNSVMYRWKFHQNFKNIFPTDLFPPDYYLHFLHSLHGEIHMLPRVMGVYLKNTTGVFSSKESPEHIISEFGFRHIKLFEYARDLVDLPLKIVASANIRHILKIYINIALRDTNASLLRKLWLDYREEVVELFKTLYDLDLSKTNQSADIVEELSSLVTVSVIVTSYNQANFIVETVQAVVDQKGFFKLEIIFADDASSDGTRAKVLNSFRDVEKLVVLDKSANVGMLQNMKKAISKASGNFIAFCEGDDLWFSAAKLHKQVYALCEHKAASYCFNWSLLQFLENDKFIPHDAQGRLDHLALVNQTFIAENPITANFSSCLYRRNSLALIPAKFWDDNGEADWLLNNIVTRHGPGLFYKELLSIYRIHGQGQWSRLSSISRALKMEATKQKFLNYDVPRSNVSASVNLPYQLVLEGARLPADAQCYLQRTVHHQPIVFLEGWVYVASIATRETDRMLAVILDDDDLMIGKAALEVVRREDVDVAHKVEGRYTWSGFQGCIEILGNKVTQARIFVGVFDQQWHLKYVSFIDEVEL